MNIFPSNIDWNGWSRGKESSARRRAWSYMCNIWWCARCQSKRCVESEHLWAHIYFHQPTTVVESEQQATATHWFFLTHSDLPTLTHSEWDSSNCFIQNQASERERVRTLPQFQPALYMLSLQKKNFWKLPHFQFSLNCPILHWQVCKLTVTSYLSM